MDVEKDLSNQTGEEEKKSTSSNVPTQSESELSKTISDDEIDSTDGVVTPTKQPLAVLDTEEGTPTRHVEGNEADDTDTVLKDESAEPKVESSESKSEVENSVTDNTGNQPETEEEIASKAEKEKATSGDNIDDASLTDTEATADESVHEEEEVDYSNFGYEELLGAITDIEKNGNSQKVGKTLKSLRSRFQEVLEHDRGLALDKFIEAGGEKDDFDYHLDERAAKFEEKYKKLREASIQNHKDFEKRKEENLKIKEKLLERLRGFIDSDETNTSIEEIRKIQDEWKNVGPIASIHNKTIWANYNALLDRYYDKRSIYFELKELDRKKNLEVKKQLCEKAEKLLETTEIRDAVQKLNELHDEYKHIGPVPREEQEALWTRFKAASDEVYRVRKEYQDSLKGEFKENLVKKLAIVDEIEAYTTFDSDSINEWNQKTKELLAIQKQWEAIGLMPKENAKEVNKKFWTAFKLFFSNKSKFFKRLEGLRKENLALKEELVKKADELKESDDFKGTADKFKRLQREWREVGPVPEKQKDDVYKRFKAACDFFFNKRREQGKEAEKEYEENLKQKEVICGQIASVKDSDGVEKVLELQNEYAKIGFVPRDSMKSIQEKFDAAIESVLETLTKGKSDDEKEELSNKIEVNMLSNSPSAQKKVERKQISARKKISHLENDISTWKNNLAFFANSKNADKLKAEFEKKIEDSENELDRLKKQLRLLNSVK